MSAPIFVTGTGTEVGKTEILVGLLRAGQARGVAPIALKPVLSGFDAGDIAGSDSGRLLAAMNQPVSPETVGAITPWRFADALSPDMAAARAGVDLRLCDIAGFCRLAADGAPGPVFIEGAGGVMSPIAADGLNVDLIATLGARPVLVCGAYLGAISHTLTALSAMRAAGAPAALTIVNPHPPGPVPAEETAGTLSRVAPGAPVLIWDENAPETALTHLGLV